MITDYDFYLVGNPQSVRLQLIEITHPAFSQVYRFVRNHALGVTVIQDGAQVFYQYMPIQLQKSKASSDLDQSINITIGDVSEIIPDEIAYKAINLAKCRVRYLDELQAYRLRIAHQIKIIIGYHDSPLL